jgi:2-isopropylmalate synthase
VVMVIKQHTATLGLYTDVRTEMLNPISQLVSDTMRVPVQPNKAVVGSNAFSHSSGIHQDGFLKESTTYEIMRPEEVGAAGSKIVLTARSGRSALAHRFRILGYEFDRDAVDVLYQQFLQVADSKKEVEDTDLVQLAEAYNKTAVTV